MYQADEESAFISLTVIASPSFIDSFRFVRVKGLVRVKAWQSHRIGSVSIPMGLLRSGRNDRW